MAVSDSAKVDLLYKKLFGVAKTDLPANKSPSNESIASPALLRGDNLWTQATSIPGTAAAVTNIVQSYNGATRIQCTADTTTVPIASVYPSWKTGLTDWVPPEFGATYFVKVYVDNNAAADPSSTGTQIFDSGSGGTGEWNFDYQSGVLNFIGGTIPAALTSSKYIFVMGYRYIGMKASNFSNVTIGNLSIAGNTITSSSSNISLGNIRLQNTTITSLTGDLHLAGPAATSKIILDNTSSLKLPVGSSADRPAIPVAGDFRYNVDSSSIEYYTGSGWLGTANSLDSEIIYADGSNATYTLAHTTTAAAIMVSINGTVQQPTLAYTVSGNQITFVEVPQNTDVIDVRYVGLVVAPSINSTTITTANVVASTSATTVDMFPINTYRSAKYMIQASYDTDYQLFEVMVVHNGTTAFSTVHSVNTGNTLGTFSATITSGNVYVQFTAVNNNTVIRPQVAYFLI